MPALPPYIIEPIWEQFAALLPPRKVKEAVPLLCAKPCVTQSHTEAEPLCKEFYSERYCAALRRGVWWVRSKHW